MHSHLLFLVFAKEQRNTLVCLAAAFQQKEKPPTQLPPALHSLIHTWLPWLGQVAWAGQEEEEEEEEVTAEGATAEEQ